MRPGITDRQLLEGLLHAVGAAHREQTGNDMFLVVRTEIGDEEFRLGDGIRFEENYPMNRRRRAATFPRGTQQSAQTGIVRLGSKKR
jgi:hypothetical protein